MEFNVFEARKTKLGANHPETLDSMGKLGYIYGKQGQVDEAQVLISQAVKLLEETIGPQHPTTLWHRKQFNRYAAKQTRGLMPIGTK